MRNELLFILKFCTERIKCSKLFSFVQTSLINKSPKYPPSFLLPRPLRLDQSRFCFLPVTGQIWIGWYFYINKRLGVDICSRIMSHMLAFHLRIPWLAWSTYESPTFYQSPTSRQSLPHSARTSTESSTAVHSMSSCTSSRAGHPFRSSSPH